MSRMVSRARIAPVAAVLLGLVVLDSLTHYPGTGGPLVDFDANTFYPEHRTLAYQENLIGSAFFAAPVLWLTSNPVLAANFVSHFAQPVRRPVSPTTHPSPGSRAV